jgi:DNA (cytosine-5)-methyltransferase 1
MFRVIKEARPAWIIAENVPGFITMEQFDVLLEMERDGSAKGELGTVVNRVGRGIADEAVEALESVGYAVAPFVIPACAVDARHRRDRLWIIGADVSDSERDGLPRSAQRRSFVEATGEKSAWAQHALYAAGTSCLPDTSTNGVSNPDKQGLEGQRSISRRTGTQLNDAGDHCRWLPEPDVGRVAHGIPSRVDRLKGLGNAIVPQVAYEILREIRKLI